MTPIIIASDRARTTRTDILARSSVQRRQTHPCSKRGRFNGSRNSAGYQPLRKRAGGSDDRFPFRASTPRSPQFLPAAHSQSAAFLTAGSVIPAVTSLGRLIAGARCVLARHRPLYSARRFVAPGRRLPGLGRAIQPFQKSSRGLANAFHCSLFPPAPTGLVAHSDTHRDSEEEMSCVTSLVTGTTKCV